jgi:hypothetical protein
MLTTNPEGNLKVLRVPSSMKSSATYAAKLEKKIEEERQARLRLEKEIDEIRKISFEITNQLIVGQRTS